MRSACLFLMIVTLSASCTPATRSTTDIEGTWRSHGTRSVTLSRTDHLLHITAKPDGRMAVTMSVAQLTSDDKETVRSLGPFDAEVRGDTLTVRHPLALCRYTFIAEDEILQFPAFVRPSDREVVMEVADIAALHARTEAPGMMPDPMKMRSVEVAAYKWRWTFSENPESAQRGVGSFSFAASPDPLRVSIGFDFRWEWRADTRGPRKMELWRKTDAGDYVENGGFYWGKPGDIWYYSSGGERNGPVGQARRYVRVASPGTQPATRPSR